MPLPVRQAVPVSLRRGINVKSDSKQPTVPGELVLLENGVFTSVGQVQKRPGYAPLARAAVGGSAPAFSSARLLATFKGELFAGSGAEGYAFAQGAVGWVDAGPLDALSVTTRSIARNSYQQTSPDCAVHPAGFAVVAWEDSSGGSRYSVVDAATGQPILGNQVLGAGAASRPKCLVLGGYVVVLFAEGGHLRYMAVPAAAPQAPAAAADFTVNLNASGLYDAVSIGGRVFAAFHNVTGGTTPLSVKYLTSLLAFSAEASPALGAVTPACIGAFVDASNNVWITAGLAASTVALAVDFNLAGVQFGPLTLSAQVARNIAGIVTSGETALVLYEVAGSQPYNALIRSVGATWQSAPPTFSALTTSTTGGTLAAATYFYVVTALGGSGETLRSNERSVTTTGATSSNALTWGAVAGAAGYRVYRGTAAGAEGVYYAPGNVTSYTDTGAASTTGSPPAQDTFAYVSTADAVLVRSVGLASKPFVAPSGGVRFLAGYQSALQPSYFLLTGAGRVVGRLAPGTGGGLTARAGLLPEVSQPSAGVFDVAYLQTALIGAQAGVVLAQTGVALAALDFTAPQMAVELSDDLHVTGGLLWSFDGAQVVEHNFLLYPENAAATPSGTGGSLSAGQYQYALVFEWWDNQGLVHQSAPSVPVTITTTTGTSSVALTIPTLRVTNRSTPVSVVVYRTAVNQSVFYRVTPAASPLLNSTTADTVSYTDTASDAAITGNAQLYTTGGEVENWAAPAPAILASYAGRLMLVPAESPLDVWFSKQVIQTVPAEFSPAFVATCDQRGGPITALFQMDGYLVVFKRDRIFILAGDGPAPDGTPVPAYPPFQPIAGDVGCRNPKSLVLLPGGLLFQSDKGIYILTRGLTTAYIGAPVESFNSANVTAAVQVPNTTQVRLTLDSGVALVYDWFVDQWSVFTPLAAADACTYQGVFTYVGSNGAVLQETPGQFLDSGAAIRLRLRTSWLSLAGLQGYQRLWEMLILGEYRSAHSLRISVAYDFDPTPHQVVSVPAGTLLGQTAFGADSPFGVNVFGGAFPLYQFRVRMLQEKCSAVQLTLEDVQSPPYGEGMALSALTFVAGMVEPSRKVPANRTFGG
jgi:hypothetical protein